ncbi:Aste57867_10633 [Aphanomyces stellatus]|uniref:Aste57867_10633 protein n=1 Tax=Aphanomyces stellatus TaxID=120398 RepID=A0A485KRE3_9STRA|nr:hypothetical protein As57867_010593 [Aphanomyces stellatus]VFT87505.1 Aste57867_10633 [Aphanomyces stellatus]
MAVMNPWKVRVLCNTRDSFMESSLISKVPCNPRQFEYHPRDPSLLVVGTFSGQVVVWNHALNRPHYVSKAHQLNPTEQVLGLSWLHNEQHRDKFVLGTQKGSIHLCSMNTGAHGAPFAPFPHLSSVHVNMNDQHVLVSGQAHSVRIYDLGTGGLVRTFDDVHAKEINLSRFANHSPSLFATCSFDKTVKLWDLRANDATPIYTCTSQGENLTICFSPDDQRLLVSAVDDEFNQYCLLTGKLDWGYVLAPQRVGGKPSYSRSYYTASGNLILSGSTDHAVVRMYCSHTGRVLHGAIQYSGRKHSALHTLSLRANPHDELKFCALVAYADTSYINELVENTMVGTGQATDNEFIHTFSPSWDFKHETTAALLEDTTTADVVLAVGRHLIQAHSVVLSARSSRLAALLACVQARQPFESPVSFEPTSPNAAPLVVCGYTLPVHCSLASLRLFLVYLYSDDLQLPAFVPSFAQELIHLAQFFDLKHLGTLIEMKCSQSLSVQDIVPLSNFAFQNQLHQLLSSCLRFLIIHRGVVPPDVLHPSVRYLLNEEQKGCAYVQGLPECYGHLCLVDHTRRVVVLGGICFSKQFNYASPKLILVLDIHGNLYTKVDTTGECPSSLVFSSGCAVDPDNPRHFVVCGGGTAQQSNDGLLLFDMTLFQWSKVPATASSLSPELGRIGHSLSLVVGSISTLSTLSQMVLFGGCNVRTKEYYNDVHLLHVTKREMTFDWTCPNVLGPAPLPRMAHSATPVQALHAATGVPTSMLVVFGGIGPGYLLSTLQILHLSETYLRWETPESAGANPGARYGHSAVWVQPSVPMTSNSILVFGGTSGAAPFQDLHVLTVVLGTMHREPTQTTWSTVQTHGVPPSPRYRHSAALLGGSRMVIFGGVSNEKDGALSDVLVLDLPTHEWSTVPMKAVEPGVDHAVIVQQSTWYTDIVGLVDGDQCDIEFVFDADTPPLRAHSLFLTRSLHMRRMLQTGMLESICGAVSLNKSKSAVRALLEFVYSDRLRVLPADLMELLDMAHAFNMTILSALLQGIAVNLLDEANVASMLVFADIHGLKALKMGCVTFILQRWRSEQLDSLFHGEQLGPSLRNELELWRSTGGHAYMYDHAPHHRIAV